MLNELHPRASTLEVLCSRHGFKVGRVYAGGVEAQMIDIETGGDRADVDRVRHAVRQCDPAARQGDQAVPAVVQPASPGPAVIRTMRVRVVPEAVFNGANESPARIGRVAESAVALVVQFAPVLAMSCVRATGERACLLRLQGRQRIGLSMTSRHLLPVVATAQALSLVRRVTPTPTACRRAAPPWSGLDLLAPPGSFIVGGAETSCLDRRLTSVNRACRHMRDVTTIGSYDK